MGVDPAADRLGVIALEQLGRAHGKLDDLDAALNRPHRVEKHLAVLLADEHGELFLVLLDQLAKTIEDPRAAQGRRRPPGRKCRGRRLHGGIHVRGVGKRHGPNHLTRRGIGHHAVTRAVRRSLLSVDPQGHTGNGL